MNHHDRPVYVPTAAALLKTIPDLADGLMALFNDLMRDPTVFNCDRVLSSMNGGQQLFISLRERLIAESDPGNARD